MGRTLYASGRSSAPMNRSGHPRRQVSVNAGGSDARSDEALLKAIADHDRGALRTLHERHAPWLVLRLSRRCSDRGIVEEAVQDTFVAVWRKPQSYKGTGEPAAWIWGIGIRRLIDQLRRRSAAGRRFSLPARRPEPSDLLGR